MANTINDKQYYTSLLVKSGVSEIYRTDNLASSRNPTERWSLRYDNLLLNKVVPVFTSTDYTPITPVFERRQPTEVDSYFSGSKEVYKSIIHREKGPFLTVLTGDADPNSFVNGNTILCSDYSAVRADIGNTERFNVDEYLNLDYVTRVADLKTYVELTDKETSIFSYVKVYLRSDSVPSLTFRILEKAITLNEIYEKGAVNSYSFIANIIGRGKGGVKPL
jgi:hypothetical protein